MTTGILLTSVSAISMALTIIIDRLMVDDFYEDNPKNAWFISSFLGALFGLSATALAWLIIGEDESWNQLLVLFHTKSIFFALGMILVGAVVSLNLKIYFDMLSCHAYTTRVAIAIAATPVFVFACQSFIFGTEWVAAGIISVAITAVALVGFEALSEAEEKRPECNFNWHLIIFIATSVVYLVVLDWLFFSVETTMSLDGIQASLIMMPFYWVGYSVGTISYRDTVVKGFVKKILSRKRFLAIVFVMEIIGASTYFFEFMGISEIDATLVSLVIGVHIAFVWAFDLFISVKYKRSLREGSDRTRVLLFTLDNGNLTSYNISFKIFAFQGALIVLALFGVSLWPNI